MNGQPIRGTRELLPGDRIAIGHAELSFGSVPSATMLEVEVAGGASGSAGGRGLPSFSSAGFEDTAMLEDSRVAPSPRLPRLSEADFEDTAPLEPTGAARRPPAPPVPTAAERRPTAPPVPTGETRLLPVAAGPETSETRLLPPRPAPRAAERSDTGEIGAALDRELAAGRVSTEEVLVPVVPPPLAARTEETTNPEGRLEAGIVGLPTVELPASVSSRRRAAVELSDPGEALRRSRVRREAQESLGGMLRLAWVEMSPRVRNLALGTLMALGLSLGGALAWALLPEGEEKVARELGPEPEILTSRPTEGSFGTGEGVDYERGDQKSFTFEVSAATRIAAVLHFQAEGLSEGELALSLNGVDQGFAPADTASAAIRELSLVLPPSVVRRDGLNTVVFDSTKNPPANDPWRIWNVWVELLPVPDLPPRKLLELAREHARVAGEAYDSREVSSGNLFRAWKSYRNAWLSLEGLDGEQDSELYRHVRFQMGNLEGELERTCSRLLLDYRRAMTLKQRKQARLAVEEMERGFPSPEHRCHNLAREKRAELEL